jgi:hypothetical protein
MRNRVTALLALLALAALPACSPTPARTRGGAAPVISADAYCRVMGTAGIEDFSGSTLTRCDLSEVEGDGEPDGSSCESFRLGSSGGLEPTGVTGARSAQATNEGNLVVWGWDDTLSLHMRDGSTRMLAEVASDPWLDATTNRVAFVAPLAEGAGTLEPGEDRRIVVLSLGSGELTEIVADVSASAPVPIPGSADVLYVSTSSGTASIVRVGVESELVVLTNAAADGVGQDFVPTYGRQHTFVGEGPGQRFVFGTDMDGAQLWSLDVTTGQAELLGPGSWPALSQGDAVLAFGGSESGCATRYLGGGMQP